MTQNIDVKRIYMHMEIVDKLLELERSIVDFTQEKDKWVSYAFYRRHSNVCGFIRATRYWENGYNVNIHKVWDAGHHKHNHPWPLAVRLLRGEYETITYYPDGTQQLKLMQPGMMYGIPTRDIYHSFRNVSPPFYSLTLNGPAFNLNEFENKMPLQRQKIDDKWIKTNYCPTSEVDNENFDDIAEVILDYYNLNTKLSHMEVNDYP